MGAGNGKEQAVTVNSEQLLKTFPRGPYTTARTHQVPRLGKKTSAAYPPCTSRACAVGVADCGGARQTNTQMNSVFEFDFHK
jgi:hypothetical protein